MMFPPVHGDIISVRRCSYRNNFWKSLVSIIAEIAIKNKSKFVESRRFIPDPSSGFLPLQMQSMCPARPLFPTRKDPAPDEPEVDRGVRVFWVKQS